MPYFDHNATTPLDPRVREAMLPWLGNDHGNPSSAHAAGRAASRAVEQARGQVAALLGGEASGVVFTASGSEANNAVVLGVAGLSGRPGHLVLSAFEHPSVREAAARCGELGVEATAVAPRSDGVVAVADVAEALRDDTRLVCLMLANNELGTVQPVAEVAAVCRERGVPLLCDAVQAVGKIPVRVDELAADYVILGGHKFHGPLGAAALWMRGGAPFRPLVVGAPQEGGRRAGTQNVPAIVGLGRAAQIAAAELDRRATHLRSLRDRIEEGLGAIPHAKVHCAASPRLPNTTSACFGGVVAHQLMQGLDRLGYAVSTGAACHSGRPEASATLLAVGASEKEAIATLRISVGMSNTEAEVDGLLQVLAGEVEALRASQQLR